MSDRITIKDVRTIFAFYLREARRVGYDTSEWVLYDETGPVRVKSGRAHKGADSWAGLPGLGVSGLGGDNVIGYTYRDVYNTIRAAAKAFEGLAQDRKEGTDTARPLYLYKVHGRNSYYGIDLMYDIKRDGTYTEWHTEMIGRPFRTRKDAEAMAEALNAALMSNPWQVKHNDPNKDV